MSKQQLYEDAAVDRLAIAMKDKLAKHRHANLNGWQGSDSGPLLAALRTAADMGDWVSVANYALMLADNEGQI